MFYKLRNTLVATMLLPLAIGCKREALMDKNTNAIVNDVAVSKVQQWLKAQPLPQVGERKARTSLPNFTLQWKMAEFDAATRTHWVPATTTNKKEAGGKPNTYLVATENEQGQITGGRYVMLLPNAKNKGRSQASFDPMTILGQGIPRGLSTGKAGFSGALLYYDVQGRLKGSQVYEAGQLQPKATANLAARDEADGDPDPNYVIQACSSDEVICIEWFWQTYVNGELISEEYLETTCCGGNSGGGSNNANALSECQASFSNFVAQGAAVNGTPTVINGAQTATKWPKTYKWRIYDAVTWFLNSYEKAVWKKVYYPSSGQYLWEFESFVHDTVENEGTSIGGTRSFSVIGNPEPNMQKYSTYIRIDYKVKHTPICSLLPGVDQVIPPVEITHYSENVFRIPGSVTVLNAQ